MDRSGPGAETGREGFLGGVVGESSEAGGARRAGGPGGCGDQGRQAGEFAEDEGVLPRGAAADSAFYQGEGPWPEGLPAEPGRPRAAERIDGRAGDVHAARRSHAPAGEDDRRGWAIEERDRGTHEHNEGTGCGTHDLPSRGSRREREPGGPRRAVGAVLDETARDVRHRRAGALEGSEAEGSREAGDDSSQGSVLTVGRPQPTSVQWKYSRRLLQT